MRERKKKLYALFLSGLCCFAVLGGCGSKEKAPAEGSKAESGAEESTQNEVGTKGDNQADSDQGESLDLDSEQGMDNPSEEQEVETDPADAAAGSLGQFTMQDINGEEYTQEMFSDYDLTMVNVFATWCSPCVSEIPDLQKLSEEMGDQGVRVVGVVLDGVDNFGKVDETGVETAKVLAERTGAKYPFLIPDEGYMNGRLIGIDAVPETFFVDKEGNIVGETYSGSRSLEDWKEIVEKELAQRKISN